MNTVVVGLTKMWHGPAQLKDVLHQRDFSDSTKALNFK